MGFELILSNQFLIHKQATDEILKCNALTVRYGLALTEKQALELAQTRTSALKDTGRIEFGGGVIDKMIYAFCDSPYITADNYEQTLHELVEIFYYYKNETLDLLSDDELIEYMEKSYNQTCGGSLELLAGRELYTLADNLRRGYGPDEAEDASREEEDEDERY